MVEVGVSRVEDSEVVVVEVDQDEVEEKEIENRSKIVRWESLMPRMVLRVLLVEADDSTRQIIAALLRKCNYKVIAISDGLKAWEILKRRHNCIDLILTELDLPSISGYALLTLIMEHDGCKNIPAIIMSSQDSISMVLKCMLKGATDFLIKPVRRNELKNLWRHVWKRLAMNVHNPQTITMGPCKVEATFEDHPATNHSSDNVSFSQKNSTVSERVADDYNLSQMNDREETGLSQKGKNYPKNIKLEELAPDTSDSGQATKLISEVHPCNEANVSATLRASEDESCTGIATEDVSANSDIDGRELPEPSNEAKDLIGRINKQRCTIRRSGFNEGLDSLCSSPGLELSLRRSVEPEPKEVDEKHVLNHSSASAFSWYSNKKSRTIFPSSDGDLMDIKGVPDASGWPEAFNSNGENKLNTLVAQSALGERVSTSPQAGPAWEPGVIVDGGLWTSHGSTFQLEFRPTGLRGRSPTSTFQREESPFLTSPSPHSESGTHSGCGPFGETANHSSGQLLHELRKSVDEHGSNNSLVDPSGGSAVCDDFATQPKSSTHGSASEVTDVNATTPDMVGTNGVEESVRDNGGNTYDNDQFRSRTGLHSAEREAALAKFRLKRKGRCFEKKVRYQSRKRLAEQRPRVKGQFVRQALKDQVLSDADNP